MARKYQQNQPDKIKERFCEHPYYRLCKTVFKTFQEIYPTMVMTPEQLFEDASRTLDMILQTGDVTTELCQELWTEKYNQYRKRDQMAVSEDGTKTEVAMLLYMVMYGLMAVGHSHYRGTLHRTLHDSIWRLYGQKVCIDVEQRLHGRVNQHTNEMLAWMMEYFTSTDSLTNELNMLFHPDRKPRESNKKKEIIYYTLPYNCPDEATRVNRINIVMRKMQEWEWIEEPLTADDFDHFFDGDPRYCNLKWIGKPRAILTELIKQILNQHYMSKKTGVSARSIVMTQFGQAPSGNKERIDAQNWERIKLIVYILDYKKPLPLPKKGNNEGFDISDLALQSVLAKELHITKDLNRFYE